MTRVPWVKVLLELWHRGSAPSGWEETVAQTPPARQVHQLRSFSGRIRLYGQGLPARVACRSEVGSCAPLMGVLWQACSAACSGRGWHCGGLQLQAAWGLQRLHLCSGSEAATTQVVARRVDWVRHVPVTPSRAALACVRARTVAASAVRLQGMGAPRACPRQSRAYWPARTL